METSRLTEEDLAVLHAEVECEFALLGPTPQWQLYEDWEHRERLRKRQEMEIHRHGDAVPAHQPLCECCKGLVPAPSGRKTVRFKARRFCSNRCAAKQYMRLKALKK